jgi:hypothetical protein
LVHHKSRTRFSKATGQKSVWRFAAGPGYINKLDMQLEQRFID